MGAAVLGAGLGALAVGVGRGGLGGGGGCGVRGLTPPRAALVTPDRAPPQPALPAQADTRLPTAPAIRPPIAP
ncbi:hypothetical protein, partial [Nocardiopsis valliformis]|uniref:hypothetical protein n=1 Tax=Nocardiopsis valliformis TaxID=239974 RepID=UPI00195540B5